MFGVMMFLTIFTQVINQMLPAFVAQRTMYEARERPSKTYSWKAFMVSSMLVEAAWNSVSAQSYGFFENVGKDRTLTFM